MCAESRTNTLDWNWDRQTNRQTHKRTSQLLDLIGRGDDSVKGTLSLKLGFGIFKNKIK